MEFTKTHVSLEKWRVSSDTQNKHDVRAQFRFNRLSAAMANSIVSIVSVVHGSLTTSPTVGQTTTELANLPLNIMSNATNPRNKRSWRF
jgi:hypothetical protein